MPRPFPIFLSSKTSAKGWLCSPTQLQRVEAKGFSLVEIVIALGVLSFVMVGILGLFTLAIRTGDVSEETTSAANLMTLLLNQRRVNPVNGGANPTNSFANFSLPALDTSKSNFNPATGALTTPIYVGKDGFLVSSADAATYGVLYNIVSNSRSADVFVMLYWPAQASPDKAMGHYETVTRIELP